MGETLRDYVFARRRVVEFIRSPAFSTAARCKLAYAYLTRGLHRGGVTVPFEGTTLYLDRRRLASDWETLREMFLPRYQPYATAYRDATVIDLGAHKGYFGAYAFSLGAAAVLSFEPEPSNFAALDATAAKLRRLGRHWDVHRAAVARDSGTRILHVSAESWTHSLLPAQTFSPTTELGTEEVEAVAIGPLLRAARERFAGRMIVKVDVEGLERELIEDEPGWALVDEVFCEVHSADLRDAVSSALESLGFELAREWFSVLHLKRVAPTHRDALLRGRDRPG
jgi:FkbM family methyltransferase